MQFSFQPLHNKSKQLLHAQLTKVGGLAPLKASPDELLGELFQDVQLRRVFEDSIVFVDRVPSGTMFKLLQAYEEQRQLPNFDLHNFVQTHFKEYFDNPTGYTTNPNHTVQQHISELWSVLTHTEYKNRGALVALPYPYVVPGGRWSILCYWDSYFIMLGLAAEDRWELIEDIIKDCAFLIRKAGHIPNGNRTYYLSRSQPPFFSHMVRLLAEKKGKLILVRYLPYLLAEYRFWMKGAKQLEQPNSVSRRAVRLHDGLLLNRYYDDKRTPRPESYKEDVDTAYLAPDRLPSKVYVDLRAGAESGWDFSSRWLKDGKNLHSIHTTDILPVDLNCILLHLEQTIAEAYQTMKQGWLAEKYWQRAAQRTKAIQRYCWNEEKGFYFDYDFVTGAQTDHFTLAAVFPLYMRVATQAQADRVANCLRDKFLKPGGLVTTLSTTGQQWDSPNGWAPLEWIAIEGLRHYNHHDLANEIKKRWIQTNLKVYKEKGKLVEKYNVVDPSMSAGGGEYELQDGFGWTNGVLQKLLSEDNPANPQA